MKTESDPNIIYGGDPEESTAIDENCPSLGDMILNDLTLGENKPSFVSDFKVLKSRSKVKFSFLLLRR